LLMRGTAIPNAGKSVADRDRKNSKNFLRMDGPARVMMVGAEKESTETTASSEVRHWRQRLC